MPSLVGKRLAPPPSLIRATAALSGSIAAGGGGRRMIRRDLGAGYLHVSPTAGLKPPLNAHCSGLKACTPHAPFKPSAAVAPRTIVVRSGPFKVSYPPGRGRMELTARTLNAISPLRARRSLNLIDVRPFADPGVHTGGSIAVEPFRYVCSVALALGRQPSDAVQPAVPGGTGWVRKVRSKTAAPCSPTSSMDTCTPVVRGSYVLGAPGGNTSLPVNRILASGGGNSPSPISLLSLTRGALIVVPPRQRVTVQSDSQPSPSTRLPSSHCSSPSRTPLPQVWSRSCTKTSELWFVSARTRLLSELMNATSRPSVDTVVLPPNPG